LEEVFVPVLEDGVDQGLIDAVLDRVEVEPERNSQLVNLRFIAHDPELCKTAANQFAQTYIEFNLDSKLNATEQASKWLDKQITIMKARVEESQEKLNRYSAGSEIIFLDDNSGLQNPLIKKLAELSTALSEVTTKRIEKEALYQELKESGMENPIFLENLLIHSLEKEYASLEAEKLSIYTSRYPNMQRLLNKMDTLSKRIENEKEKIVRSVKSSYNALVKEEAFLKEAYQEQKKQVNEYQKKSIQYQILEREVDTNKELYNSLLQRQKEVGVSATMTATNIQIIDRAELPRKPFKPKKVRNILIALVVGLMAGIGLAFFFEYFDNTVKDSHYLETKIQLPTLGMIPYCKESNAKNGRHITSCDKKSPLSEVFRSIGTFIQLSSSTHPPKIILLTSPGEKEGKTTTAINTAIAMTESVGKGIIIDADLRKSTFHTIFNLDNSIGLTNFLSGNSELNEELIKLSTVRNLDVITSGPKPPNPSELLGSQRMRDLLDFLSNLYDFIIIDSPPMLGMTDSIHLSRYVDGVILLARAGSTPQEALIESKKILMHINAKILGVVLNGIKEKDFRYGYYSYYYSSYYK
jgi:succinoglycan biosynthesis transport protein ExoP